MVLFSIIHMILSIAFTSIKDNTIIYSRISQLITFCSLYLLYKTFFFNSLINIIPLFNGTIKYDLYNDIFSFFILTLLFFILLLTSFYPVTIYINKGLKSVLSNKIFRQFKITEYCILLLFILSGGLFLMLNNDIITLFLAIELQSYGLYLLCTIYKDSENSTKAGLTYFLLGGLSSCIILLGLSLIYVNIGNTSLENIYIMYDISNQFEQYIYNFSKLCQSKYSYVDIYFLYVYNNNSYINMTLVIITIGLLFKISGAPFHFWSPDVYDNVPTIITTSIAILAKISILIVILEFSLFLNNSYSASWINNILVSSLLSLIIGSLLGLAQSRIKRLYAYSTINHLGFILLALSINSIESIQAFIFYLIQYSFTNLGAFILLISIGYELVNYMNKHEQIKNLKDKNNSPIQLISQLGGLFKLNPLISISLSIVIFSFLGIPPLAGFFGKQMVLSASLDKGYIFMSLIGILTSVIGGVYYLVINKNIFLDKNAFIKEKDVISIFVTSLSNSISVIISIIIILIIGFMFIPNINTYLYDLLIINCDSPACLELYTLDSVNIQLKIIELLNIIVFFLSGIVFIMGWVFVYYYITFFIAMPNKKLQFIIFRAQLINQIFIVIYMIMLLITFPPLHILLSIIFECDIPIIEGLPLCWNYEYTNYLCMDESSTAYDWYVHIASGNSGTSNMGDSSGAPSASGPSAPLGGGSSSPSGSGSGEPEEWKDIQNLLRKIREKNVDYKFERNLCFIEIKDEARKMGITDERMLEFLDYHQRLYKEAHEDREYRQLSDLEHHYSERDKPLFAFRRKVPTTKYILLKSLEKLELSDPDVNSKMLDERLKFIRNLEKDD